MANMNERDTPPRERRGAMRLLREARVAIEMAQLVTRYPELERHPRGHGEPVLVLPGLGTGDGSTLILRRHLERLGYRVHGWGLGLNSGDVPRLLRESVARTRALARESGQGVRLIGWSLGGYLAREVAREVPQHVERVITLGSPVVGGPRHTALRGLYERAGVDLSALDRYFAYRERRPIRVPITAIYSEDDGIVDWHACIDRTSRQVEHVCVRASHLGMCLAPEVLRVVAERLADGAAEQRTV